MSEQKKTENEYVNGIPVRSEAIGFKNDELVVCGACGKTNPPNRFSCLYCDAELELTPEAAANVRLHLKEIEPWEKGINIVLVKGGKISDEIEIAKTAKSSALDREWLETAMNFDFPSPLLRVSAAGEAVEIKKRLATIGLEIALIEDEMLDPNVPPVRLRAMDLVTDPAKFVAFNSTEVFEVSLTDISHIVVGRLFETRTEVSYKKKRKDDKKKNEEHMTSDSGVIDVYLEGREVGFRVLEHGFDYSCLGNEKSLFASTNIGSLAERLRSMSPRARFIDDYDQKQRSVGSIWELTRKNESKGVHRAGVGVIFSKGESFNNTEQFTKYSRLQRLFI